MLNAKTDESQPGNKIVGSIIKNLRYADDETPIFWPPDMKNWLIRKDPDAGKD